MGVVGGTASSLLERFAILGVLMTCSEFNRTGGRGGKGKREGRGGDARKSRKVKGSSTHPVPKHPSSQKSHISLLPSEQRSAPGCSSCGLQASSPSDLSCSLGRPQRDRSVSSRSPGMARRRQRRGDQEVALGCEPRGRRRRMAAVGVAGVPQGDPERVC